MLRHVSCELFIHIGPTTQANTRKSSCRFWVTSVCVSATCCSRSWIEMKRKSDLRVCCLHPKLPEHDATMDFLRRSEGKTLILVTPYPAPSLVWDISLFPYYVLSYVAKRSDKSNGSRLYLGVFSLGGSFTWRKRIVNRAVPPPRRAEMGALFKIRPVLLSIV